MKINVLANLALALLFLCSCEKESNTNSSTPICDLSGTIYSGTFTNQLGQSGTNAYFFKSDNFVEGSSTISSSKNAYGGYSNNCDSLTWNLFNTINNNYYYFKGKFSNNKTVIIGTYKNMTSVTEMGTINLVKQ